MLERTLATVALVVMLGGIIVLASAADSFAPLRLPEAMAQAPEDLQRQIDRLERRLDVIDVQSARLHLDGFTRLAAAERELELNRRIIYGMALPLIGQLILSFLLLRKVHNGRSSP
ncbi:MAG: hypothetical protein ACT4P5_23485 [Armatimonadota bacterium]